MQESFYKDNSLERIPNQNINNELQTEKQNNN